MYTIETIKACINLYIKLKNEGVIGKKRIEYIPHPFRVSNQRLEVVFIKTTNF